MVLRGFPAGVTIVVSDRCVCVCVPCVLLAGFFIQHERLVMVQTAIQGEYVSSVADLEYSTFIQ